MLQDDRPPQVNMDGLLARFEGVVKHLQNTFPDGPQRFTQKGLDARQQVGLQ